MATRARPFTAAGIVIAANESDEIMGVVYTGFTSVTVHNGIDATGPVVLAGGAGPQSILCNSPVDCDKGVYVEVAGVGKGSVLA